MVEIGSCEALLFNVKTVADGSARITLDISPEYANLVAELIKLKLSNQALLKVGFVNG